MYVAMQIDTISGAYKPIGIFEDIVFANETIKELKNDKRFFCYITDDIPVVVKK